MKDVPERRLRNLVCAGNVDLQTAQHEVATDWIKAYQKYNAENVDKTTGVTVQNVDTDVGKSQLANMLARKEPGPGYVHLPCGVNGEVAGGLDIEAVAELTAEYRRETNLRGYTVTRWYKRMGRANHRLDCFLYSLAALAMSRLKIDECALQRIEAKNTIVAVFRDRRANPAHQRRRASSSGSRVHLAGADDRVECASSAKQARDIH